MTADAWSRRSTPAANQAHGAGQARPGHARRGLPAILVFLGLVVAAIGSVGAPLVPTVAADSHVSLATAQWTLTITLLTGAIATPILARLGGGARRRPVIVSTIAIVLAGSVLTTLPLNFAWLLAGRALQGIGLGLTSLVIGAARDAFDVPRRGRVIGLLSVTSVAGIGLGYPVAGVLSSYGGVRVAYGVCAAVVALALVLALVMLPAARGRPSRGPRLDVLGATLLSLSVSGLLLGISEAAGGPFAGWLIAVIIVAAVLAGAAWITHALRSDHPLVDLRLIRIPLVLIADLNALLGGLGVYLLISLATRYVQTPSSAGYGFGGGVITAGLILVPFSIFSFAASRLAPILVRRLGASRVLPGSVSIVLTASVVFGFARGNIMDVLIVMGLAGLGIGGVFATVPALIVDAVPAAEATSAVGFNQVARSIGVTAGSALCGMLLAGATHHGQRWPADRGYTLAAGLGAIALLALIIITSVLVARQRSRAWVAP